MEDDTEEMLEEIEDEEAELNRVSNGLTLFRPSFMTFISSDAEQALEKAFYPDFEAK